ncbi:TPA: hypothetical protein GXZ34_04585 [bacterium]|nr:hypothetical protein [bacterium]
MVKEVSKNSLTYFGPLVYYELAKQIELKALECDIAKYKDKKFIVSDCFLDKDELLVTGSKLISHSVLKNLKKGETSNLNEYIVSANCLEKAELLITNYKKINDGDLKIILNDLFKMYLLDNLCDNKDRHEGNWGIIYTDDKGASLAPVYDNEFIFNLENRDNVIFDIIAKSNYSNLQTKPSPLRFRLSCNSRHLSSLDELETLFKSSNDHTKKEILELINKLDVYSAIKEVELKVNHSLPNKIKKLITNTFKINKDLALSTLTKDKPHIK